MELFADDGGVVSDDYREKISVLRTIFERAQTHNLSISPQKTALFMTKVVFTGEHVGTMGIRPDLAKLTMVVDWAIPTDLQNLGHFLGLMGYFRTLIKDYVLIAAPLTDLQRGLEIKGKGRGTYQHATWAMSLVGMWTPALNAAFIALKAVLSHRSW